MLSGKGLAAVFLADSASLIRSPSTNIVMSRSRNHIRISVPLESCFSLVSALAQPAGLYTIVPLGTVAGQSSSMARGINNAGHVVGRSGTASNAGTRAFLWTGGPLQSLGAF